MAILREKTKNAQAEWKFRNSILDSILDRAWSWITLKWLLEAMGSDIGQSGARALERVTPFAWENPIGVHVKKDGKNIQMSVLIHFEQQGKFKDLKL